MPLRRAGVALLVSVVAACAPGGAEIVRQAAPADAPNVLLFVTDDQRTDATLGVMPKTRLWFKRKGTRFARAFATTPLCCPSRASMFTGQYAHNHGIWKNFEGGSLPQRRTIQRLLWVNGYRTALAGKYLNGWDLERDPPFFDRWAMQRWGYNDSEFNVDGTVMPVADYSTSFIADKTVEFLEAFELEDEQPWFVYVAPFAAHKPFVAEERYQGAPVTPWYGNPAVREQNRSDKPDFLGRHISAREGRQVRKQQLRTLISVDDMIGRVFTWMKQHGELQDTLAIFVSDNGRSWGEHRLGGKRLPYTASIRIPLMVRWPGHVRAGDIDRRLVANIDIPKTIAAAATIRPEHNFDGQSLLGGQKRSRLLLESRGNFTAGLPTWYSLRTNSYQYVEYYGRRGRRVFREYYDLEKDPWQLQNLFGNRSKRDDPDVKKARLQLDADRTCRGRECP